MYAPLSPGALDSLSCGFAVQSKARAVCWGRAGPLQQPRTIRGVSPKAVCVLAAGAASAPSATLQCQLISHGPSLQAPSSLGLGLKCHLEAKKPNSLVPLPH